MLGRYLRNAYSLEKYPNQPKSRWVLYLGIALSLQFLVAGVLVFPTLFINYIGAPQYFSTFATGIWLYGLTLGVVSMHLTLKYPHPRTAAMSEIKKMMIRIGAPILYAMFLAVAVLEGGPLTLNYIFGTDGSIIYTIEDARDDARYCGYAVSVEEIDSLMMDMICRVPRSLRDQLKEGDQIEVIGSKTFMGIRPQSYRLISDR